MRFPGLNPGLLEAAEAAVKLANEYRLQPTVTSVYRTIVSQQQLWQTRQRCLGGDRIACQQQPYPVNRPGDSAHNWGLAFDSWVPANQMQLWTAIRRAIGWQVPENDLIHAELPNWRSYVQRL
jgi:LAS superfamily LD-carboxypeptidase LdcB